MPHIKFEPMRDLESFAQKMRQFVEEMPETFSFEFGKGFDPKVELLHDAQNVYIHVEMPGVRKEDVKVSIKEEVLTVTGTKSPEERAEAERLIREISYGAFTRKIPLPCPVISDPVAATVKDGVLSITLKKVQPAAEREFSINID